MELRTIAVWDEVQDVLIVVRKLLVKIRFLAETASED